MTKSCNAYSEYVGVKCQRTPSHEGSHQHHDRNMLYTWTGDAGRPAARVDGWLSS